jgi:hypothetical protein
MRNQDGDSGSQALPGAAGAAGEGGRMAFKMRVASNFTLKRSCQNLHLRVDTIVRVQVPQIWMTYEELACMLGCNVLEARDRSYGEKLDRKISRDGKKRVKLNPALTTMFIEQLQGIATDRLVNRLRSAHELMRDPADQPLADTPQRVSK